MGSNCWDQTAIHDSSPGWDFGFGDEEDGVGAFDSSYHSLCKATKIIGETLYPDFLVGATGELTVIEGLSGVGVNSGVCFADGYLSNGEGVLGLAVG